MQDKACLLPLDLFGFKLLDRPNCFPTFLNSDANIFGDDRRHLWNEWELNGVGIEWEKWYSGTKRQR